MKKVTAKGFSVVELLIILVVVALVGFVGFKVYRKHTAPSVDTAHPQQFVTADFIDVSKIFSISKFRSFEGHDFSKGGETCRSMKHYFTPQRTAEDMAAADKNNGLPPHPDGTNDIDIFSPFDGKITRIDQERMPVGEQLYLVPDAAPSYTVRLFHIYKLDGIKVGTHLKAGQKIGVISAFSDTDISVEANQTFISIFQVMTDKVFAEFQARGAKARDDFIISRAYRDAHTVSCNQDKMGDQKFYLPAGYDQEADQVRLSGYIAPVQQKTGNNGYQNNGHQQSQPGQNSGNNSSGN